MKLLIFLDYDGTIVPIASTPHEVKLPEETNKLLQEINLIPGVYLGIVSGRSLEEIKRQVNIPNIVYAGNHGLEWEIENRKYILPKAEDAIKYLSKIIELLKPLESKYPGVFIENKRLTLTIHYRLVDEKQFLFFHKDLNSIIQPLPDVFPVILTEGKKSYEIKPKVDWGKGDFVKLVIDKFTGKNLKPFTIYIGDDNTDEDVFKKLPEIISIKVGGAKTAARYHFKDYKETILFLKRILDKN